MSWQREMAAEIADHVATRLEEKRVPKRLFTTAEAAEYLGMSDEKLRQMAAGKRIKAVKIDANLRFDRKDLDALIDIAKH